MAIFKAEKKNKEELEEIRRRMELLFEEEEYQREHAMFWFDTTSDGGMRLNRLDGTYTVLTEKMDDKNEKWNQGWQRAVLFAEEMKIWDATGFAASMNAFFVYYLRPEFEGESIPKYIILTTPQFAEDSLFSGDIEPKEIFTSEKLIKISHEYTESFYQDKKAQLQLREHILYGVSFEIDDYGDVIPLNLVEKNITDAVLQKYEEYTFADIVELVENARKKQLTDKKETNHMNKSSIEIVKKGITAFDTDCIVNAANEGLWEGGGVCGAIFKAAGSRKLQKACNDIGSCKTGSAVITPGFRLKAKYIIHAVGPVYKDGKHEEAKYLYSAYEKSLMLAKENGCHSIAFPLISAGIFGYPKKDAWRKAIQACNDFIRKNPKYEMKIYFAILDDQILSLGQNMLQDILSEDNTSTDFSETVSTEADSSITATVAEEVEEQFVFFWHEYQKYGCFSQWFPSRFQVEGIQYETAEQYMMAKKALLFNDITIYQEIMREKDPKKCKDLGKLVRHFDAEKWDAAKWDIIYQGNKAKFSQNVRLKNILLNTGNKIIAEASPYDKIWGIGLTANDPDARNIRKWKGENLLGSVLMTLREDITIEQIRDELDEWFVHGGVDGPLYELNDYQKDDIRKLISSFLGGMEAENLTIE